MSCTLGVMLLVTHIVIALSSLVFTTYVYFHPTRSKINLAYGLVGATLVSGAWLVVSTHSPLLSSCVSGLAYLAAAATGIALSVRKLAYNAE